MGRRPRGRRRGRPAGPGRPARAAAAARGSACAARSRAATACSSRCRSRRERGQGDARAARGAASAAGPTWARASAMPSVGHAPIATGRSRKRQQTRRYAIGRSLASAMDERSTWSSSAAAPPACQRALVLGRARRRVAVIDAGSPATRPPRTCRASSRATGCRRPTCSPPAAPRSRATAEHRRRTVVDLADPRAAVSRSTSPAGRRSRPVGCCVATGLRDDLPDIPGPARAVGTRPPALPVLPRLGGPRPAARRALDRPRTVAARPAGAAVV